MALRRLGTGVFIALAALLFAAFEASGAPDYLAQAKQYAAAGKAYPELTQLNDQISTLISRMEGYSAQLKEYRKARIRGSDRRYAGLTRELNQARSKLAEVERKLDKAPSLDTNRFPAAAGGDRGSASSDVRERAIAGEMKKYDTAKASLRQSLKALSDYYDQLLKEIAKVR